MSLSIVIHRNLPHKDSHAKADGAPIQQALKSKVGPSLTYAGT